MIRNVIFRLKFYFGKSIYFFKKREITKGRFKEDLIVFLWNYKILIFDFSSVFIIYYTIVDYYNYIIYLFDI